LRPSFSLSSELIRVARKRRILERAAKYGTKKSAQPGTGAGRQRVKQVRAGSNFPQRPPAIPATRSACFDYPAHGRQIVLDGIRFGVSPTSAELLQKRRRFSLVATSVIQRKGLSQQLEW
jgi:hypothetical protein